MLRFNRMTGQNSTGESRDGRRRPSMTGRLKVVAVVALSLLTVGVVAAYGALNANDTATGTGALASESTGNDNTADGNYALRWNTAGFQNTAVGSLSGDGNYQNATGSNNTFLGFNAAPGTDTEISNATALGANAAVSQSNSLILGALGVNVGIDNSTPASRLQIGSGATGTAGEYLQIPVLLSTAKTPPASDCNNSTLVGRLVLLAGKKMGFWACSPAGVWVKV